MKRTILITLLCTVFLVPAISFAQNYTPLQPIPELGITGNDPDLGDYLNRLFRGGILAAGILAVIMVTVGGIQYMTTDAVFGKTQGRERIVAALGGLILALASWIILNTINSQLITGDIDIETAAVKGGNLGDGSDLLGDVQGGGGGQAPDGSGVAVNPGNHVELTGVNIKSGSGTQVAEGLHTKLQNLNQDLNSRGINWRVTEAYPPTRTHKSSCHQTGTCIDANFTGGSTNSSANVLAFIQAANAQGLRAVYETNTESERQRLIRAGVPAAQVKNFGSWISAPHFSVYSN